MIDGNLVYVGDRENARIQIFDRNGQFLRQWKLGSPFGLVLAQDHSLYMADAIAGRILKIDSDGKVVGISPDRNPARDHISIRMKSPWALMVQSSPLKS